MLRSFAGPFVLTLFITLFVLVMQFLWKYVDDLVGKGLEWYTVVHLLFYASASFVPLALPLAVLLSSIMTMGALGEHFELTALKSSGASLIKITRSLIVCSIIISIAALGFSNYIVPIANLKFGSLLYDIRQQRPAFNIKPGVFYNGLAGYSIRVGSKGADGQTIHNVIIYDHTAGNGNNNVLYASSGKMNMSEDKRYLILELYNGKQYEEIRQDNASVKKNDNDFARISFVKWRKVFDLSEFKLNRTEESLFKDDYRMLNLSQLTDAIDTLKTEKKENMVDMKNYCSPYLTFLKINLDSFTQKNPVVLQKKDSTLAIYSLNGADFSNLYERALLEIRNIKSYIDGSSNQDRVKKEAIVRNELEYHRKITLSISCFLLFLIGAPLGAIIRKGGLGLPFVVSVVFFVFYYMISVSGEKFAIKGVMSAPAGMWMSPVILLPIGIFLVYKATRDSALFRIEAWLQWFKIIQRLFEHFSVWFRF